MDTIIKENYFKNPDEDIRKYIKCLQSEAQEHICLDIGSTDSIYQYMMEANSTGRIRAWYDQEGLLVGVLMVDVGYQWWSSQKILLEETMFCLEKKYSGFQRVAMRELDRLARTYEAHLIYTGNLLCDTKTAKLVRNGYMKHGGYTFEHGAFLKRVEWSND